MFHIKLSFPRTYPQDSPSATIITPIPHPHVINDHICLDLLSDYEGHFHGLDDVRAVLQGRRDALPDTLWFTGTACLFQLRITHALHRECSALALGGRARTLSRAL